MTGSGTLHRTARALGLTCLALLIGLGSMARAESPGAEALAAQHASLHGRLSTSPFGRPLVVDSGESAGRVEGVIRGELAHAFAPLAMHLQSPAEWCAVVVLHVNVKACTHEHAADGDFVTIYTGRKEYEPPARMRAIRYRMDVVAATADYLRVTLTAPSGPLATRDYALALEATPIGAGTFVALSYGFRPSPASRLATASYLATVGGDKSGFTIVGRDGLGNAKWIGGVRGIVERNAMRSFLALDARLASLDAPLAERFEHSVQRMAELTERYPAQLVEMPAVEYVAIKRREWREQGGAP